MPRPAERSEIGHAVVPFTVDASAGRGCPDTGLSLGSESDVTFGLRTRADGVEAVSIRPKYQPPVLRL